MVAKNYADTPIHLHAAAGRSMLAHLIQMVKDGRVKTDDGKARSDSVYRLCRRDLSIVLRPLRRMRSAGRSAGNSHFSDRPFREIVLRFPPASAPQDGGGDDHLQLHFGSNPGTHLGCCGRSSVISCHGAFDEVKTCRRGRTPGSSSNRPAGMLTVAR